MHTYLINCGSFNIMVRPADRAFYVLDSEEPSRRALDQFLEGETIDFSGLTRQWFAYRDDEIWHDFEGKRYALSENLSEEELIDLFVLKKNNFGSLVARREDAGGAAKIFKPNKVALA